MKLRTVEAADSCRLLRIYEQYIDTPVTFECSLPSAEDFSRRILDISRNYPYLVCEEEGIPVGYAYAHRQMEREAYQWNAELSVYVDRRFVSKGIGKKLYGALIEILKLQGIKTVYGCVTLPNEKSVGLHEALGFRQLGVYRSTGYKCGEWHDAAWFEKPIAPYDNPPSPIQSITKIAPAQIEAILQSFCFA